MKFTKTDYYDDQDGQFIASKYFVDGENVDENDFYDLLEEFDSGCNACEEYIGGEIDYSKTIPGEIEEIEEIEECGCDCINCTLEHYVRQIQEINGGCEGCIREVLELYLADIIEHIVIEDVKLDIG